MSERSDRARERTKRIWEERRVRWDKYKKELVAKHKATKVQGDCDAS